MLASYHGQWGPEFIVKYDTCTSHTICSQLYFAWYCFSYIISHRWIQAMHSPIFSVWLHWRWGSLLWRHKRRQIVSRKRKHVCLLNNLSGKHKKNIKFPFMAFFKEILQWIYDISESIIHILKIVNVITSTILWYTRKECPSLFLFYMTSIWIWDHIS